MKNISDKLAGVEQKIRQLIQENQALKKANAGLHEKNKYLESKLSGHEDAVSNLERELKVAKNTTNGNAGLEKNNNHLKQQLEKYAKELDQCIEWLSNS